MKFEDVTWQSTELANPQASGQRSLHSMDVLKSALSNAGEVSTSECFGSRCDAAKIEDSNTSLP